jgi:hypothetical protein
MVSRLSPSGEAEIESWHVLTSQGHPRTIFGLALERRNLLVAEAAARKVGRITACVQRRCVERLVKRQVPVLRHAAGSRPRI